MTGRFDELGIPRLIHRIWLGDKPQPAPFLRYEERWRDLHPGWRVITWRDDDLHEFDSAQQIAAQSDVVIKADLARYHIVYRYGGLYVDTDFEPLRNIEPLLVEQSLVLGEESSGMIAIGFFAAAPEHPFLAHVLAETPGALESGRARPANLVVGPAFFTRCFERWSAGVVPHTRVLPRDTLYPYLWGQERPNDTAYPSSTFAVHHWAGSWQPESASRQGKRPVTRTIIRQGVVRSKRLSRRAWNRWSAIGREEPEATPELWGISLDGDHVFVQTRHGFPLLGLSSERNITPALLTEGTYGREYVAALRTILGPHDVFVDVGANIGVYACAAAVHLASGGRVFAFEPNPRLCRVLRKNVYMNRMLGHIASEVEIYECAVSDAEGTVTLSFDENDPTQGTIVGSVLENGQEGGGQRQQVEVATTTLDRRLSHLAEVQLLKVDVEGAELKVLRGAWDMISAGRIRFVDLELEHRKIGTDWDELVALLHRFEGLGAELHLIDTNGRLARTALNEAIQTERIANLVVRFPRERFVAGASLE